MLYYLYSTLKVCSQSFPDLKGATDAAKDAAKANETIFSPEEIDLTWKQSAKASAGLEPVLRAMSPANVYSTCSDASNRVASLVMLGSGKRDQTPTLPEKDF